MTKKRVLVVDDNPAIHEDIYRCLTTSSTIKDSETQELERELFGDSTTSEDQTDLPTLGIDYDIDSAYQGEEAIKMIDQAAESGSPYTLVFMDVRMPPGLDGIQTITKIWEKHPKTEIIICTAHSDYSWDDILDRFGPTDNLLFMKKPFDTVAIKQAALSLTTKWDISRKSEAHIRELESQVENRAKELQAIMAHLETVKKESLAIDIARNKSLSTFKLEIKNPLNGILGITELLLDTNLDEDQEDYARTIKRSSDNLMTLINEILDFTKIEEGLEKTERIQFDLKNNLENVIQLISGKTVEKGLEIALLYASDVPDWLTGDPLRIRQILLNLMNNVISRTSSGTIILEVKREDTDQKNGNSHPDNATLSVRFTISSTGDTIAPIDQAELTNSSQDSPELDSGLPHPADNITISKRLVASLNGNLWVDQTDPSISSIHFSAGLGQIQDYVRPQLRLPDNINGIKCLILCDYPTGRKVLSLYLKHWGAISEEATSISQAVEKINAAFEINQPYTIIIVDLKNSEYQKLEEIALKISKMNISKQLGSPKMICMTGDSKRGDAAKMEEIGYSAYLTKPIKQSQLLKTILLFNSVVQETDVFKQSNIINKYKVDEMIPDHTTVLVIDDDIDRQRDIATNLLKYKIFCDVSHENRVRFDAVKRKQYSLILIRAEQLNQKGIETINHIRSDQATAALPIIAMTDTVNENTRKNILALGLNDYIAWPLDQNEVVSVLGRFL